MRLGAALVMGLAMTQITACVSAPAPIVYERNARERLRVPPPQGPFSPNAYLRICPGMTVSNAPPADANGWMTDYKPIIYVVDLPMAQVPSNEVCLSSGFGMRNGRPHRGIDLTSRPAGDIFAAAPGVIVEIRESSGYGLMVLLDHGNGIFTRYAHLEYFEPTLKQNDLIGFGQPLGRMGATGQVTGVHLHFEILTGDYSRARGSADLTAQDPFSFPAYLPPGS